MSKIYNYKKISDARKKARKMKKLYGYTPTVFKETHKKTKTTRYVVVKPTGLKKI